MGGLVQAGEQALQTDGLLQGAVLHRAALHQIQKRRGLPRKAEPGRLGEVLRTRLPLRGVGTVRGFGPVSEDAFLHTGAEKPALAGDAQVDAVQSLPG